MTPRVLLVMGLLLPTIALADSDDDANLNVFLSHPDYTGCLAPPFDVIEAGTCEDLVTVPISGASFLWVVLSDGDVFPDGVGGCQFGIDYAIQVNGWSLCTGGSEIPETGWPASGTGNAVTWAGGCYEPPGENAVVGFFTLDAGDVGEVHLTVDPRIDVAMWSDCIPVGQDLYPWLLGGGDLSTGFDPNCEEKDVPVLGITWGRIKAAY